MQIRPIIGAALQAAGLAVAGFLVPLLGQIAMLFAPVPLVTVSVLHGRPAGLFAAAITTALVAALGGFHPAVLFFILALSGMALAIADGVLRNLRHESTILFGGAAPLFLLLAALAPLIVQSGKDPIAFAEEFLRTSLTETRALYVRLGLTALVQTLDTVSDKVVYYAARLIPGIIAATTMLQSVFCYGIARSIVLRKQPSLATAARPPLALWHLPDPWVWGLIATLAVVALAPHDSSAWFLGLNIAFLWGIAYTAQGVAIVDFFLRKGRMPVLWRSILHSLILTIPPSAIAVVVFGVIDIWTDVRKIRVPPSGTA